MLGILDFAFREFQNFAFRNSRFIAKNSKCLLKSPRNSNFAFMEFQILF